MMKNRRIGQFEISRQVIEDSPALVQKIMGKCVIVRAELRFDRDVIHYIAVSPEFDDCLYGLEPPMYDVIIQRGNMGPIINFVNRYGEQI